MAQEVEPLPTKKYLQAHVWGKEKSFTPKLCLHLRKNKSILYFAAYISFLC